MSIKDIFEREERKWKLDSIEKKREGGEIEHSGRTKKK